MGYNVKKDESYKATEGGGNDPYRPFSPLPAGPVAVGVYEVKEGKYKSPANAGRDHIRVQFKVLEGQKGANRRLFSTIGIFEKWGPTAKNPEGFDNFTFFDFFAAVEGKSNEEFRKWFEETPDAFSKIPGPKELGGRKVIAVTKIVPDTYGYEKALAAFRTDEGLTANVDSEELREAFAAKTGYTRDDYTTNEISGFKVYDGNIPQAGEKNTSSPVAGAVEL